LSLEFGRKLGQTASLLAMVASVLATFVVLTGVPSSSWVILWVLPTPIFSLASPFALPNPYNLIWFTILLSMTIVEYILFVLATHNFSRYYSEPRIFKNLKNAIIFILTAVVLVAASFLATSILRNPSADLPPYLIVNLFVEIFGLMMLVAAWVYVRRAFIRLAEKSGIKNFSIAGLLYLIGNLLPFIFALIAFLGWVFALNGFKSLKPAENKVSASFDAANPPPNKPVSAEKSTIVR
jgi:uncharacterized membrane protein